MSAIPAEEMIGFRQGLKKEKQDGQDRSIEQDKLEFVRFSCLSCSSCFIYGPAGFMGLY